MLRILSFILLVGILACGKVQKRTERIQLSGEGKTSILVLGGELTADLKDQASQLGVSISGSSILKITGDISAIQSLDIPVTEQNLDFVIDTPIEKVQREIFRPSTDSLYQAKKEFGILEFWKNHPKADGRDVVVGVIDDGISPNQSGLRITTTGARKLLAKGSSSSFTTFDLISTDEGFKTTIIEGKSFSGELDLNLDGEINSWEATVNQDGSLICLDLNRDNSFGPDECKGSFSKTGDYFNLPKKRNVTLLAEVNLTDRKLRLTQPEIDGDSHGEGVASVMAGYRMGNLPGFDGVAPGAQIVDYDLSESTNKLNENEYTLGTFLLALDWMAGQGVEVVNISYSLFFTNTKTQTFMARALDALVNKHNMIISFSAGNNGPALGSLNRRLMYPPSVLVVGAYVPKELDERVHGVTGLPEDGRVVYYSSRGPGAGSAGPLMIAPLSSLTHSTPDQGFRAFSGTSSASPAMAGAAAVLISAIKQEGLKINAATVVHALRQSARRIEGEPFISQGYGVPQIAKALSIYRSLMSGEKFLYINHTVNKGGLDGTTAQAIFVKKSEVNTTESYRVSFSGAISPLASESTTMDLLIPIEIEYTEGIKGPRELWVSASSSRISVDVNIDEMLKSEHEAFGEIRLISKLDHSLLAVIPVTAVDDLNTQKFIRKTIKVSSQEGSRLHLDVPKGIKGLKVRARLLRGERKFLNILTFNPDFIRTKQIAFTEDFIMPTDRAGHYQLTLVMVGGTEEDALVEFEVEAVNLEIKTRITTSSEGKIEILNSGYQALQGDIIVTSGPTVIKSMIFNKNGTPEVSLTLNKGTYGVSLKPTAEYDLSYFYSNCSIMIKGENDTFIPHKETSYTVSDDRPVSLKFRCTPFDFGLESSEDIFWQMLITSSQTPSKMRLDIAGNSKKVLKLPNLTPGVYTIGFLNPVSNDQMTLGRVEIY